MRPFMTLILLRNIQEIKTYWFYNFLLTVKGVLLSVFISVGLSACSSESQSITQEPQLGEAQHNQRVLATKQAILSLDVALVEKLSAGIDVNRLLPDNSSLLAWAVEVQEPKLVSILLDKGAVVDIVRGNRFSPLIQACRYGNSDIVNAILDVGADPNQHIEEGTSAFHLCAGSAPTKVLARMLDDSTIAGAINTVNQYGQTALMWAAYFGHVENFNFLVERGASVNAQTKEGYSALLFAIKSQNLAIVQAAIQAGADPFVTAKDGTTAAQLGVYTKNFEFLTWFTSNVISRMDNDERIIALEAFDRNGHQLLHAAVTANQPNLVAKLLALGANPHTTGQPSTLRWRYEANFKTQDYVPPQQTPIEIANEQGFNDIIAMLTQ